MPRLTCVYPSADRSDDSDVNPSPYDWSIRDPVDRDVNSIRTIAIFPPLGIARLGDSTTQFFIGPELPRDNIDGPYKPIVKFRDPNQRIRRQAARFRVYAHDDTGVAIGELNEKTGFRLKWTVHVMNTKAALRRRNNVNSHRNKNVRDPNEKLKVNPGEKSISSEDPTACKQLDGPNPFSQTTSNLGQLQVDDVGHLLFIPANGSVHQGASIEPTELNNAGWIDDVCDGLVSVEITHLLKQSTWSELSEDEKLRLTLPPEHRAAVVSGPPKFAWGIHNSTSLFDIMEDIYSPGGDVERPEFYKHIYPVLLSASSATWVHADANRRHGGEARGNFIQDIDDLSNNTRIGLKGRKQAIFDKLRKPNYGGRTRQPANMPALGATLRKLQYERFRKWKDHDFEVESPVPRYARIEDADVKDQPMYLTRASLETTNGGSFEPGMETSNIVTERNTYNLANPYGLNPGFRLDYNHVRHGDLTKGLAVPWQADFYNCGTEWWPSSRPSSIKTNAYDAPGVNWIEGEGLFIRNENEMVRDWKKLGFITAGQVSVVDHVTAATLAYVESERRPPRE